ncbi:hypothetical protein GOBAR_DD21521 [Gossypium barbadense]|nr:hypothetical protein GOBAR_DD21521 [Gossypium barbadense]
MVNNSWCWFGDRPCSSIIATALKRVPPWPFDQDQTPIVVHKLSSKWSSIVPTTITFPVSGCKVEYFGKVQTIAPIACQCS